jgi:predicted transcriptional regulator YdeE
MTRHITITQDGVQYMINIDIESRSTDITYHIATPQHFRKELPENFDIVQSKDNEHPQYDDQAFTEKGREIAQAIWKQVCTLPPQFKGGKSAGKL